MRNKTLPLIIAIILASFPTQIQAQYEEGYEILFLDIPIVSIASKTEETIVSSSGTVYTITDKEIDMYGWRNLIEILNAIPNMDFKYDYNWLQGGQRGFTGNFSGTLLLLDGREVQNLIANETFITNAFPAHYIKRIEILQGPNSTLYGGNATQGVINIITKHGEKQKQNNHQTEFLMGEASTEQISGTFKKNAENIELGFSASYFKSDRDWNNLAEFINGTEFSRNSDYLNFKNRPKSSFKNMEKAWTANFYTRYRDLYFGFDYFDRTNNQGLEKAQLLPSSSESKRWMRMLYGGIRKNLNDSIRFNLEAQYVVEQDNWILTEDKNREDWITPQNVELNMLGQSWAEITRPRFLMQLDWDLNENNKMIGGYDWWKVKFDPALMESGQIWPNESPENIPDWWPGKTNPEFEEITKHSAFVQHTMKLLDTRLKLTAGIRFNHQDFSDDSWLPRGSFVYQTTKNSALKLTYGEAFRPPTTWELHSGLDVKPQETEMFELNYTQIWEKGDVLFTNILSIYTMETTSFLSVIVGRNTEVSVVVSETFQVDGIEDQFKFQFGTFSGMLGMRRIYPDPVTVGEKQISLDVPETKMKLGLSYQWHKYLLTSIFIDWWDKVEADAPINNANANEVYIIDSQTMINLNIRLGDFYCDDFRTNISIYVENLLNEDFYHANNRGNDPVQFLQNPRNIRIKAGITF